MTPEDKSNRTSMIIDNSTFEALHIIEALDLHTSVVDAPYQIAKLPLILTALPKDVARAFGLALLHDASGNNGTTRSPLDFGDRGGEDVDSLLSLEEQWGVVDAMSLNHLLTFEPELRDIGHLGEVLTIQSHPVPIGENGGVYFLFTYESPSSTVIIPTSIAVAWNSDGSGVEWYRPTGNLGVGIENEWQLYPLPEPVAE